MPPFRSRMICRPLLRASQTVSHSFNANWSVSGSIVIACVEHFPHRLQKLWNVLFAHAADRENFFFRQGIDELLDGFAVHGEIELVGGDHLGFGGEVWAEGFELGANLSIVFGGVGAVGWIEIQQMNDHFCTL